MTDMKMRLAAAALGASGLLVADGVHQPGRPCICLRRLRSAYSASASRPCGTMATPHLPARHLDLDGEPQLQRPSSAHARRPTSTRWPRKCGLATNYHNITPPQPAELHRGHVRARLCGRREASCPTAIPRRAATRRHRASSARARRGRRTRRPCRRTATTATPATTRSATTLRRTTRRCPAARAFDVPYTQLATDLAAAKLPAFSFITPNLIDDMHNGTVADGDRWLAANLPAIFNSTEYRNGSTVRVHHLGRGGGGHERRSARRTPPTSAATWPPSWSARAPSRAPVGEAVQPLLAACHRRAAAGPAQAGPGRQRQTMTRRSSSSHAGPHSRIPAPPERGLTWSMPHRASSWRASVIDPRLWRNVAQLELIVKGQPGGERGEPGLPSR